MDNRQLLDLLLLGLTWLEEDRGDMTPRRASMVFHTMRFANVIGEGEQRKISSNTRLITLGMEEMHIERGARKPPKKRIEQLVSTTSQRLVVLAVSNTMLDYSRLFGRDGYYLLASVAGMDYANSRSGPYGITKADFLAAWEATRTQLGRQIGAAKRASGKPPETRRESARYRPSDPS